MYRNKTAQSNDSEGGHKLNFEALFKSTTTPYLILLPDSKFTMIEVNDAYLQVSRTQREGLIGKGLFEVFPDNPSDPEATGANNVRASLERVIKSRQADTMPIQKYDMPSTEAVGGFEERYWSPHNAPIFGEQGTLDYIIHRVEDVTEFMRLKQQKPPDNTLTQTLQARTAQMEATIYKHSKEMGEAQEALRASNERYHMLTSILPVGIFHTDEQGNYLYVNPQWQEITGLDFKRLEDKRWFQFIHPADQFQVIENWQHATHAKEMFKMEFRFLLKGEQERWVLAHITPEIAAESGYIKGYVGSLTDITDRKKLEEVREKHAEELAAIDRAKTIFFSNVSHEFKTPLTLISGPAEEALLDNDHPLPSHQQARVMLIRRNAWRLLKLVNSLLDFARLEAGRMQASYEPTHLVSLTTELISFFRSAVEKAGLTLNLDMTALDEPVYVDKDMWEKIVFNLLSNALKYTLAGSITITLKKCDNQIELAVIDTGIGIPDEALTRIFERFYRIENSPGRSLEGAGIGLSLTQELVKLHGGTLRVASELNKGTTFTVDIPLGKAHLPAERVKEIPRQEMPDIQQVATPFVEEALGWLSEGPTSRIQSEPTSISFPLVPPPTATLKRKVLVVEDNADMREYLRSLLAKHWEIQTVSDGESALKVIQQEKPDLVLTDIMMPKLDGFQLVQALRALPETHFLPIILLTAKGREQSCIEGLQLGADDYLVKPFSTPELLARVRTHLELGVLRTQLEEQVKQRTLDLIKTHYTLGEAIEERLTAEKAEAKFKMFLEAVPDALVIVDKAGKIILVNTQTEKLFNYRREELLSMSLENLIPSRYREKHTTNRMHYFEHPNVRPMGMGLHLYGIKKTGEEFPVEISLAPLEAEGHLLVLAAVRDVSERKALEKALYDNEREAELKEREMQARLLANMGHEFRTPLTLMLNPLEDSLTDTLQPLNATHLTRLTRVKENALRLLKMVNTLLDFSKMESGYLKPHYEPVDFVSYTASLVSIFRAAIEKAGLALHVEMSPIDEPVYIDKDLWEKIIFNLLSNALKFTSHGSITLRVSKQKTQVTLEVSDTGMGIPEKELPRMFERFHRVEEQTRLVGGTGIGLAFTQELVKMHGGSIAVSSVKGKGSTFTVVIPLGYRHLPADSLDERSTGKPDDTSYPPRATQNELEGWLPIRLLPQSEAKATPSAGSLLANASAVKEPASDKAIILVVEDNADLRDYIRELLTPFWEVHTAEDGEDALQKMRHIHPALILSDIMMPKMDGITLLKTLRTNQAIPFIPIILLSARDDSVIEGLQLGAEDYLVKPFVAKELIARIRLHLELGLLRNHLEDQVKGRTMDLIKINHTLQEAVEERLKAEKELAIQITRTTLAEEYQQKQEEFIDTLCHEVRNPLTGVYGTVFSLRDTLAALENQCESIKNLVSINTLDLFKEELAKAREQLDIIEECTQYQKEFMDEVLDLSKLESAKVVINPGAFELKQLIARIGKIFSVQLKRKQLNLLIHAPENEQWLNTDTHLLSHILTNLLSNAIKFTEQGSITIAAEVEAPSENERLLHIRVKDTGIGMSAEETARLFNRFAQANRLTATQYGGSGLGLLISKKYAELLGGTLQVESQKGHGTTFQVTIRCQPVSAEEKIKLTPSSSSSLVSLQNKKILIAEDNEINQRVLRHFLSKNGAICVGAMNGREAVACQEQQRFDLILMDMEMPHMGGLEATHIIRDQEAALNYRTPIIGLSGYTREEQKKAALEGGMDTYLTKPYDNDQLLALINLWLGKASPLPMATDTQTAPPPSPLQHFENTRAARRPEISTTAANSEVIRLPPPNAQLSRSCCF